jgi:hypothetical protein
MGGGGAEQDEDLGSDAVELRLEQGTQARISSRSDLRWIRRLRPHPVLEVLHDVRE